MSTGNQLQDYSTLLTESQDKLKLLNNLYFKGPINNPTLCKNEPILGGNAANNSTSNINMLLNLRNNDTPLDANVTKFIGTSTYNLTFAPYISLYTPSLSEGTPADYTPIQLTTDFTNTNSPGLSEINCLGLLNYNVNHFNTSNILNDTQVSNYPIYTFMQGLYTLYSLFEAKTWEAYKDNIKNQTPINLSIRIPTIVKVPTGTNTYYKVTTSNTRNAIEVTQDTLKKYTDYVSPTILTNIFESTTFNAFVARRLIYLWITLCNYLIATVYLKNNSSAIIIGPDYVTPLIKGIYNLFVQINNSVKYNSIEDVGTTDTDFDRDTDEINLEKTQLKAEIFKTCVNYINSENPQSRYDYLFETNGDAKTPLNEYYDVVLKSTNRIGKDKYPKLKAAASNPSAGLSHKNEILKGNNDSLYNNLNTLTFSITPPNTFLSTLSKDPTKTKTNEAQITFINQLYINNMHASAKALRMTSSSTGVFGDINNAIGNYIGRYTISQDNITNISSLLSKGKANLITIQNLLSGRLSIQKKQRIIEYIAIFIFAVFVIIAISLLVIKVEKKTKLYSCIGLVLFSLIHFLGIQVLLNSSIFMIQGNSSPVVESFALDVTTKAGTITSSGGINNYLQYYNISIINQVNVYLENTFTLVTLLETYKAYGNLNASLEKELSYYTNIVSQLNNAQSKVNKVYFSSYMNTIDVSALLHMFQILSIIVAAACTVYIITEEMPDPSIKKWIGGISTLLVIITFIIYILEIKKHVHTNPVKIYWSNPGLNTHNLLSM